MPRGQLYVSKFSIVKLGRCIRGIQLRTKPEESESSDEDHFLLCLSEHLALSSVVRYDAVACESYCITGSYEREYSQECQSCHSQYRHTALQQIEHI